MAPSRSADEIISTEVLGELRRLSQQFVYIDRASRADALPAIIDLFIDAISLLNAAIAPKHDRKMRVERSARRLADLHARLRETPERERAKIIREQTGISKATYYRHRAEAAKRKFL